MPASASGVSTTRCSPKSFCSPSVTRKTPPSLPTSSPMIITLGSDSSDLRRPALSALERVIELIGPPPSRRPLRRRRRILTGRPRTRRARRRGSRAGPRTRGRTGTAGPDRAAPGRRPAVAPPPGLELAREPVPGGVVGGGVGAHPVGERLDQHRALALAGGAQRVLGHGIAGQHVVAVDLDAGEAEAACPLVDRGPALALGRRRDRPLVVLAEEHDRRVEDRRPGERLAHVALAGGAVAEVDDGGLVLGRFALDAHRVPGGMQGLVADDDRVEVELMLLRVPAAVVDAAEELEQAERVEATAPGHAVLPVGRERHVPRGQRAAGPDLRGLLAEQGRPQAKLALALERDCLGVDSADKHHVAVHALDVYVAERVLGVIDPLALGGKKLDSLGGHLTLPSVWSAVGSPSPA